MLHTIALLALTVSPTPPLLTCIAEGTPLTLTLDAKMHLALQHGRERLFAGELAKVTHDGATYSFRFTSGDAGQLRLDEGETELAMGKDNEGEELSLSCSPMTVKVDRLHLAALVEASRSTKPLRLASCAPEAFGESQRALLVEPGLRPGTAYIRGVDGNSDGEFAFVAYRLEHHQRVAGSGAYCYHAAGFHCLKVPSLRLAHEKSGLELQTLYEFDHCRVDSTGLARLSELLAEAP